MRVFVAGASGLVGSAIVRELVRRGIEKIDQPTSQELDLTNRLEVFEYLKSTRPRVVIDAAAKVGGIHANDTYPAQFLSENLQIQVNLMDAASEAEVERFLFLGSSCIYPKFAPQPINEASLLTGELEPTNSAYAIAKIAGIQQIQAERKQYGRRWISAMPTNIYGPGDNFHLEDSHVVPALIRRFHDAKVSKSPRVTIWGSGSPLREFLYSDDLARAVIFLIENYDDDAHINVGSGSEISIHDLAKAVARTVGFHGELLFDKNKPDGTPRKLLDNSRIEALGWSASVSLEDGLRLAYEWFVEHEDSFRGRE